ncbi:hypothetical protein LENED_002207 [Lentinula edodes]|uniref:Uncharacterized protein n=1 Tax=Lentinula edodes TaxID=5353 RepID=A0A1Q3E085_LENED|nr:hypothetical protein LENED_002207 [Lentinula edodes]
MMFAMFKRLHGREDVMSPFDKLRQDDSIIYICSLFLSRELEIGRKKIVTGICRVTNIDNPSRSILLLPYLPFFRLSLAGNKDTAWHLATLTGFSLSAK